MAERACSDERDPGSGNIFTISSQENLFMSGYENDGPGRRFLEIEVVTVDNVRKPIQVFLLRDAKEKVRVLKMHRVIKRGKLLLERIKVSTDTLAHEMRAPLASIVMIMEILLSSQFSAILTKDLRDYFK